METNKILAYSLLIFLGINVSVFGQSEVAELSRTEEVLRFAQPSVVGTARIQGLGGTGTALGGDVSSIFINPAGLGFYTKNDVSVSTGVNISTSNIAYSDNNNQLRNKGLAIIPNISAVFASKKQDYEPGELRSWAIGIGYNRSNNFNQLFNYTGAGISSYTNHLTNQANGLPLGNFANLSANPAPIKTATDGSMLAYNTYLIDANYPYNNTYQANYGNPINGVNQTYYQNYKVSGNEFLLAGAVNLNDRLYLGASGGFVYGRYRHHKSIQENITSTTTGTSPLNSFIYDDDVKIDALGAKFNAGFIWRIIKMFQVGANISSPTIYRFKEQVQYSNNVYFNNYDYVAPVSGTHVTLNHLSDQTPIMKSKYNVTTPWKASVGATFLLTKIGLLTAEAEYVDYTAFRMNAKASEENTSMAKANNQFSLYYKPALNLRAGAEIVLTNVRLRAGVALYGNPYNDSFTGTKIYPTSALTGGIGYRNDDFYIDFAYVLQNGKGQYINYTEAMSRNIAIINSYTQQNIVITGGILF